MASSASNLSILVNVTLKIPIIPTTSLRIFLAVVCCLSMIGSFIIVLSYAGFKTLRTKPRLILVHLSIMDFGVAASNLTGIAVNFNQYYFNPSNATYKNGLPVLNQPGKAIEYSCIAQAAFADYFTVGSFLWTISMAVYLYLRIVHYSAPRSAKASFYSSIVACYSLPLLLVLWKLLTNRLGYSPYSSEGWCGDKLVDLATGESYHQVLLDFIGYQIWVFLTFTLVPVLYVSVLCYIYQELKRSQLTLGISRNRFWTAVHSLDYKLLLIPLAFMLLRVWSLITIIIYVYMNSKLPEEVHEVLTYLSGIGDSGQGFVNALLFVVLTKKVRQKLVPCHLLLRRKVKKVGIISSGTASQPLLTGGSRSIQKRMAEHPNLISPNSSIST